MACGGSSLLAARSNHRIVTCGIVKDSVTLLERKRYEGRASARGLAPSGRAPQGHDPTSGGVSFFSFFGPAAPQQFDQKPTCDEVEKALD